MIILGVDPGTIFVGFCVLEKEHHSDIPTILESGVLNLKRNMLLSTRVGLIYETFCSIIERHDVTLIALETPFLAKNPQVYLKLGYVRGILYLLSHNYQCDLREYAPSEIKKAIVGVGSATKEDVAVALCKIFPALRNAVTIGIKTDITDALAIGVTGLWKK